MHLRLAGLAQVLVQGTLRLYLNGQLHDYVIDGAGNSKVLGDTAVLLSFCERHVEDG